MGRAEFGGSLPVRLGGSGELQHVGHGFSDLLVRQFTLELRHRVSSPANLPLDRLGRSIGSPASVDEIGVGELAGRDGLAVAVGVVAGGTLALADSPAGFGFSAPFFADRRGVLSAL